MYTFMTLLQESAAKVSIVYITADVHSLDNGMKDSSCVLNLHLRTPIS